jgi:hypothetical protein
MTYDIFRIIGSKPGCVDYLGTVDAGCLTEAEQIVEETFDHDELDYFDIQPTDDSDEQ